MRPILYKIDCTWLVSRRAVGNWEAHLKDIIDHVPKSGVDQVYEDIYVKRDECVDLRLTYRWYSG